MSSKISATIWDIGGVLVRMTNTGPLARWERRLDLAPGTLPGVVFASGVSARASLGQATIEDVWRHMAERFSLNDEERLALMRDFGGADTLDTELAGFIRRLRLRYKIALLSNAWPESRALFTTRFGLNELADLMVFSAEEGIAKPDPRIFRLTAERMGVPPEACIFVDDYAPNVAGAVQAGMTGIRFERAEQIMAVLREQLER